MWFGLPAGGGTTWDGVETVATCSSTTPSGFTEDNWEIYMDARVVQLYYSLSESRQDGKNLILTQKRVRNTHESGQGEFPHLRC